MIKRILVVLCAMAILFGLSACSGGDKETDGEPEYTGLPPYDKENIESYFSELPVYKGLTVDGDADALWKKITNEAQIKEYPAEQVEYYAFMERAKYSYYAEREGIEYDELLEGLSVTEESIRETAKKLVKEDLVFEYVVLDAKIELTDEEKQEFFQKYVDKFKTLYGHDEKYIREYMTEQIYDTMLFDKTMEYLLLNNTVNKK